jgi:D-Tyr-tRNAtyr deacylase
LALKDINGDMLLVSQFTLHASTKKGNRPSYIKASKPDVAIPVYEKMIRATGSGSWQKNSDRRFWCRYESAGY